MTKKKKINETANLHTVTEAVGKQSFSYEGNITVKIQRGNKVVSVKNFHNAGRLPLFKFLCNCLAGSYLEQSRPLKIRLFNYIGENTPARFNWDDQNVWKNVLNITPYVTYDSTPVVTNDETNYKTTYHFKINGSYVSGSRINLVGIYGNNVENAKNDACAYFLLTTSDKSSWNPIDLDKANGDYSIIFEWTMMIKDINTSN